VKKALSILFVAIAWLNPNTSWSQYPQVDFVFGYRPFDLSCEGWTKQPIDQSWYDELRAQLPAFRSEWSKEAPVLLGETVAALNAPFRRNELTAFITLCAIQSMSTPLIISGRPVLVRSDETKSLAIIPLLCCRFPRDLAYPPSALYTGKSLLLPKYKDETPVARNHLHLFSVVKHVYLKLGREQQLSDIVTTESSGKDPSYARAWEIVNKIEGHESFLKNSVVNDRELDA
jgi:hypothetical protein